MNDVKVKICGVTTAGDAIAAVEAGADYIGINLLRGPRRISPERAVEILAAINDAREERAVEAVMLVALGTLARMAADAKKAGLYERVARRQVYGLLDSAGGRAEEAGLEHRNDWLPWHVAERASLAHLGNLLERVRLRVGAVVLDTAVAGQLGGTGRRFNWQWIAEAREAGELARLPAVVLAGGLKPGNVAEAVRVARPWAVDVSSGVEGAEPGVKDHSMMREFVAAAKRC